MSIEYQLHHPNSISNQIKETIGTEEGDVCNRDGCEGILEYGKVRGCTCFISPPCFKCVENPLICETCGWSEVDRSF